MARRKEEGKDSQCEERVWQEVGTKRGDINTEAVSQKNEKN